MSEWIGRSSSGGSGSGGGEGEPEPASGWARWYRDNRLVAQIAGLGAVAGLLVVIVLISVGGDSSREKDAQLRQDLAPLMESIRVDPVDLPTNWLSTLAGLGLQSSLREVNLGAASDAADSVVGAAVGWFAGGDPRLLSSGIIVADSPEEAEAAFERLRVATPEETVAYVEPTAELVQMLALPLGEGAHPQFGIVVQGERPSGDGTNAGSVAIEVTVLWTVVERSLLFVAVNGLLESPPIPAPVDLEQWLADLAESYLTAEAALLAAAAEGAGAASGG